MKQMVLIAVIMILSVSLVNGQSGEKVQFQELGLSFTTPNGWTEGVKDDLYIMGHHSIPGLMIVTENTSKSARELKSLAMQGMSAEGIQLSPKGDFTPKGNNQIEGFYEGIFQGSHVRVFAIGLINKLGNGINIFIVTEKAKFTDKHIAEAKKLARSVKFFQQSDSKETTMWKEKLVGKKLRYFRVKRNNNSLDGSLSSISDSTTMYLYKDGTCSYYSKNTASQSGSYGSGVWIANDTDPNNQRCEYKIYTTQGETFLEMYYPNRTSTYTLTRNSKRHTFLNGTRYAVVSMDSGL